MSRPSQLRRVAFALVPALLLAACSADRSPTDAGASARATAAPPPTTNQLCGVEFVALYDLTGSIADQYLSDRDRNSLRQKVAEAAEKASLGKLADAQMKLTDYGNQVVALLGAAKPKIEAGSADQLMAALNQALGCLGFPPYGS